MLSSAKLNPKQEEALDLLRNDHRYTMLYGGGGSGKSFVICLALIIRCLGIPNSTHGVFRETGVSLRNSLFNDTFRAALRTFENGKLIEKLKFLNDPMEIHFPNGSKILFSGLDDSARIERLFGMEYMTVWVNEVSQIKSFEPVVSTLIFRLRQNLPNLSGKPAKKKFIFDCNPPPKSHFVHRRFIRKIDETGNPLSTPDDWQCLAMNTADNVAIVGQDYIDQMKDNLSLRDQRRMIYGEFLDDTEGSLFPGDIIDLYRHKLPDDANEAQVERERVRSNLRRVAIAVDPATTAKKKSDSTGIIVAGLDDIGHAYVLEDATMKGSPDQWSRRVSELFQKWGASVIVAETNQGGDMVANTLRSSGFANLPIKTVHAKDGKLARAEPVSTLYEKGKVHHVGFFRDLEEQMESFAYDYNPTTQGSPDRLDALVYALTELMVLRQSRPSSMHVGTVGGFFG